MHGKTVVVKVIAIACAAIWLCQKILPLDHQYILTHFAWLRYVGFAGLFVLELKLIVSMIKMVISGDNTHDLHQKLNAQGMPVWLAKLAAVEASIWRRIWLFGKRFMAKKES